MSRTFSSARYSSVTATVALAVALGGTSYAAATLPARSVGTRQLKADAVTTAKVQDGSLLASDFKLGQLPAGARGLPGAPGAAGPAGPAGPAGVPALDYNVSAPFDNPAGAQSFGSASCDPGMRAVGGGVLGFSGKTQSVNSSGPFGQTFELSTTSWGAFVNNANTAASSFRVYVICTNAGTVTTP